MASASASAAAPPRRRPDPSPHEHRPLAAAAAARLDGLRRGGLYRRLRGGAVRGPKIVVDGRPLINLASNDYLGLAVPAPGAGGSRAGCGGFAASPGGMGSPGSRLASGNDESYAGLEAALAVHRSAGAAIVYPTGYMANLGAVQCLAGRGDCVLSDSLNHASMIDACRLSGARISVYGHNDMASLRDGLAEAERRRAAGVGGGGGRTFVLTEGVFSMDGDVAALPEICELAASRGASVVLDDAHGDFVMGYAGRGTADALGVQGAVDVHTSSLSKGLGSFGGYVAADAAVADLLVNASRPLVYTSALPPAVVLDAAARMAGAGARESRRRRLWSNVERLGGGLAALGFECGAGGRGAGAGAGGLTHIIPVMVGAEGAAVELGEGLARLGVYALPVRYPTVARGAARIRVSVTALLGDDDIDRAVEAFGRAGRRLGLL